MGYRTVFADGERTEYGYDDRVLCSCGSKTPMKLNGQAAFGSYDTECYICLVDESFPDKKGCGAIKEFKVHYERNSRGELVPVSRTLVSVWD